MKPRLLVVELHHLGDAVLSLPLVRGASEIFEVHVLCRPATREVYELLENPPVLHPWRPPWAEEAPDRAAPPQPGLFAMARRLRARGFDATVCAWADARVSLLTALTGAPRRAGFPMTARNYYGHQRPWRKRRLIAGRLMEIAFRLLRGGRPLLTQPLHRRDDRQPHLDCWRQLAAALDAPWREDVPWFPVPPPPAVVAEGTARAHARGRRVLAVHAGGRLATKRWPLERFAQVLDSPAVRARFDILLIQAPGDTVPRMEANATIVPTRRLGDLAATLGAADALLCNDSLAGHMAAAIGRPVISIFGSGEPAWFAPWRSEHLVVRRDVCPLHPCIDRCGMPSIVCLEAVQAGDVIAQLERLELPGE